MKKVLNVGSGPLPSRTLAKRFTTDDWKVVRLDIDPGVEPDVVADMLDMEPIETASMDAVWSCHNIEHVYHHQVAIAFREFLRVLKPGGYAYLRTPDIQTVCGHIARGAWDEVLYEAPSGPIRPLDIVYGSSDFIARGRTYMAHKTGFTEARLIHELKAVGFERIETRRIELDLWAMGFKPRDRSVR